MGINVLNPTKVGLYHLLQHVVDFFTFGTTGVNREIVSNQIKEGCAKSENITSWTNVILVSRGLFRAHELDGSQYCSGHGHSRTETFTKYLIKLFALNLSWFDGLFYFSHLFSTAPVQYQSLTLLADDDVCGFDVSMNNVVRVRICDRMACCDEVIQQWADLRFPLFPGGPRANFLMGFDN